MPQGGVLLGSEDRFTGDAARDRVDGLGAPVKCASPFLASSGAVCSATASLWTRPAKQPKLGSARSGGSGGSGSGGASTTYDPMDGLEELLAAPEHAAGLDPPPVPAAASDMPDVTDDGPPPAPAR